MSSLIREDYVNSCFKDKLMFSPIGVVLWQRVGDVGSGHQQEGPQQVYDTTEGQNKEGGAERDPLFIQKLESKEEMGLVRLKEYGDDVHVAPCLAKRSEKTNVFLRNRAA